MPTSVFRPFPSGTPSPRVRTITIIVSRTFFIPDNVVHNVVPCGFCYIHMTGGFDRFHRVYTIHLFRPIFGFDPQPPSEAKQQSRNHVEGKSQLSEEEWGV